MTPLQVNAWADLVLLVSNLLALDQSSNTTGYAVFKNGNPVVISHFDAPKGQDLGYRLEWIRNKVLSLIEEYDIDEVVFEDIQLQDINGSREAGIKTFKVLAEVFGVIHELLTEIKTDYTTVPPIVWKATFKIAGKGRDKEKKMAQAYIKSTLGLACTEDEADAACIALHVLKKQASEFDWA